MGGVEAVLGIGGAQFAGLHNEGDEACNESENEERIPISEAMRLNDPHTFRVSRANGARAGDCVSPFGGGEIGVNSGSILLGDTCRWNRSTAWDLASGATKI